METEQNDHALPDTTPRPPSGALTKATGFLGNFSHTLNPYIGCRFGCSYCYVRGLAVHRFHQPHAEWGDYAHPRDGIAALLEKELSRFAQKNRLGELAIFMSTATDPYQPLERKWRLTRACLEVFLRHRPALLHVQTRSPLVQDDFALLRELGACCWLNFTLETDLEAVRRAVTPRCPPLAARLATLRRAREAGLNVQITVSPCLPYSAVASFGQLLLAHGDRVLVDTYVSGDATGGSRTAHTAIPSIYSTQQWGNWRAEESAHALYNWLRERIGDRAGWSEEGFAALPKLLRRKAGDPPQMQLDLWPGA